MSIHFESKNVNAIGRVAAGVKTIKLESNDEVIAGLPIHSEKDIVAIVSTKGYGKKVSIKEFTVQGRGGKGLIIYKPNIVYGYIAGASIVTDNDSILLSGQPNSICVAVTDLPLLTRDSFGNMIIKSTVSSMVKI